MNSIKLPFFCALVAYSCKTIPNPVLKVKPEKLVAEFRKLDNLFRRVSLPNGHGEPTMVIPCLPGWVVRVCIDF